jgi:hypothetical protein
MLISYSQNHIFGPCLESEESSSKIAYLVESLCYKPEGCGFDSLLGHRIFFNLPDPSIRTVDLGSTEPLTEMNTRNLPGRPARKADDLIAIC